MDCGELNDTQQMEMYNLMDKDESGLIEKDDLSLFTEAIIGGCQNTDIAAEMASVTTGMVDTMTVKFQQSRDLN